MTSRHWARSTILLFLLAVCLALGGCFLFSNTSPVASFTASPTKGVSPLDVQFDALASYDTDGHVTQWDWEFGDGATAAGATVLHRFSLPGTYVVRLTVRDNRRATSVATTVIEVLASNERPRASMTASPLSGNAPLQVMFDASASTDEDGTIEDYAWDFGDGTHGSGVTAFHRYTTPGTYTAQLTVTDDLSGQGTASADIVVAEAPPFVRRFVWEYAGRRFDWTVSIPSSLYYEYRGRPRGVWDQRDYDEYVLDPLDDAFLEGLMNWIQSQVGTDYYAAIECAFHFVQAAITYTSDPVFFYEYPKYPIETLVDGVGDCEDTAILYASLVRTLGAGAMIAAVDTSGNGSPDHMITLVPVSQQYADGVTCAHGHTKSFWTYGSTLYAFAETTGSPSALGYYLSLGCDPWGLAAVDFKIVWDVSRVTAAPKLEPWHPAASSGPIE
jgi:PKD repeat protein